MIGELSNIVKDFFRDSDFNISAVAEKCGLSSSNVQRWAKNKQGLKIENFTSLVEYALQNGLKLHPQQYGFMVENGVLEVFYTTWTPRMQNPPDCFFSEKYNLANELLDGKKEATT